MQRDLCRLVVFGSDANAFEPVHDGEAGEGLWALIPFHTTV